MVSVIISLFILTSYTISVCVRCGVPDSLSQTFFNIKHKWIFSACVAVSACLLYQPFMSILPIAWQWLGFLTVIGAMFVAFAPNLIDELQSEAHMGGAIVLGLSSQFIVALLSPCLLLLWCIWIPFALKHSKVFWAEMVGGAALYIALVSN